MIVILALAVASLLEPTGGEFCWDPLPGAETFVLYYATPGPPGVQWAELARVPAAEACAPGSSSCCARFTDAPGDLVFYVMKGE